LGGLVGVVTIKYLVTVFDVTYDGGAKIVFGYPPGLKKPFARVLGWYYDDEALLTRDLQEYVELELNSDNDGDSDDDPGHGYRSSLFEVHISLGTVFHKDMIFTRLDIEVDTWF
jgi:hypothetical protein